MKRYDVETLFSLRYLISVKQTFAFNIEKREKNVSIKSRERE